MEIPAGDETGPNEADEINEPLRRAALRLRLQRGMDQAAAGELHDRGSFVQHLDPADLTELEAFRLQSEANEFPEPDPRFPQGPVPEPDPDEQNVLATALMMQTHGGVVELDRKTAMKLAGNLLTDMDPDTRALFAPGGQQDERNHQLADLVRSYQEPGAGR